MERCRYVRMNQPAILRARSIFPYAFQIIHWLRAGIATAAERAGRPLCLRRYTGCLGRPAACASGSETPHGAVSCGSSGLDGNVHLGRRLHSALPIRSFLSTCSQA